jgi:hypothetical protein
VHAWHTTAMRQSTSSEMAPLRRSFEWCPHWAKTKQNKTKKTNYLWVRTSSALVGHGVALP